MKTERSTGTLITVFSGMAALLCLLVGLQLLVLEAQIAQADAPDQPECRDQFRHWKAQAHTGAVMSLGAGILIFLFGLRHHTSTRPAGKIPFRQEESPQSAIGPDSLSIRVFESDADDHYVEISSGTEESEWSGPPAEPQPTKPQPTPGPDNEIEPEADPTEIIVKTIREAVAPGNGKKSNTGGGNSLLSFWGRFFGPGRRD